MKQYWLLKLLCIQIARLGCGDMPCQNGATCRNTLHNPLYLYKCKCSKMYKGFNCEGYLLVK